MPIGRSVAVRGFALVLSLLSLSSRAFSQATTRSQNDSRPVAEAALRQGEIRILYDDAALYIAARMYDSLGARGVRSALARRDQVMNGENNLTSDRIAFVFDTFRDKNTRTWFELNPDGVKGDHQNGDASFDPVWDGAAKVDSLGWTAEFRIPFSQLKFSRA